MLSVFSEQNCSGFTMYKTSWRLFSHLMPPVLPGIARQFAALSLIIGVSGCSVFSTSNRSLSLVDSELSNLLTRGEKAQSASPDSKVANPPAKSIRFDGNEVVLGSADSSELSLSSFTDEISGLVADKQFYSASRLIDRHHRTAERYLWRVWCEPSKSASNIPATEQLLVDALSKNLRAQASWRGLFAIVRDNPVSAANYRQARQAYIAHLKDGDPSDDELDAALQSAAQELGHTIVLTDALQLMAARQTLSGGAAWSESLYRQASELCLASGEEARAADLQLLACTAAEKATLGKPEKQNATKSADRISTWQAAVATHLRWELAHNLPIDTHFWISAEQTRPAGAAWPSQVVGAMRESLEELGCTANANDSPEYAISAAVGLMQYQRGEPQPALVNFKKAETLTRGDNQTWLRIAQSRCLAALDQTAAAAAILSGPATSSNSAISSSARAALGSAKLQSGAYEQGAQLLNRAIMDSAGVAWPSKREAQADLALALSILGETDRGLSALHAAQRSFERADDKVGLLKSLNNELRLLQHEGRTEESQAVEQKIASIQRS